MAGKRAHRRAFVASRTLGARYEIREAKWWRVRSVRSLLARLSVPSVVAACAAAGGRRRAGCNRSRHDRPDRHDLSCAATWCTRSISRLAGRISAVGVGLSTGATATTGRRRGPAAEPVTGSSTSTRTARCSSQRGRSLAPGATMPDVSGVNTAKDTQRGGQGIHGAVDERWSGIPVRAPSSAPTARAPARWRSR